MRCLSWLAVVLILTTGCNREPPNVPGANVLDNPKEVAGGLIVGEPLAFANLTIFPILSEKPKQKDRFITLDEGLKAGTVEIRELGLAGQDSLLPISSVISVDPIQSTPGEASASDPGDPVVTPLVGRPPEQVTATDFIEESTESTPREPETAGAVMSPLDLDVTQQQVAGNDDPFAGGPSVNELLVHNRSDKPLYLMPGEILLGGQQDRTIGEEIVIQPGPEPVKVAVFCVEHGRWHGRDEGQTTAALASIDIDSIQAQSFAIAGGSDDSQPIAKEANRGKFIASVGNLNNPARMALQSSGDQQAVWDKVKAENSKSNVETASDTFTANYTDAEATKRLDPYLEKLLQPVADMPQVVGVVVAVNGKPQSIDVFESTPLFKKLWPKLLKSYALDAANQDAEDAADAICTLATAEAFLNDAATADVEKSETRNDVALTRRASTNLVSFSLMTETQASHDRRSEQPQSSSPASAAGGMGGGFGGAVHSSAFAH